MVAENPTWGAPRIHGELLKLSFDLWLANCYAGADFTGNRAAKVS
jgi:hypothetical protein